MPKPNETSPESELLQDPEFKNLLAQNVSDLSLQFFDTIERYVEGRRIAEPSVEAIYKGDKLLNPEQDYDNTFKAFFGVREIINKPPQTLNEEMKNVSEIGKMTVRKFRNLRVVRRNGDEGTEYLYELYRKGNPNENEEPYARLGVTYSEMLKDPVYGTLIVEGDYIDIISALIGETEQKQILLKKGQR